MVVSNNGTGLIAVQGRLDDPGHQRVYVDKSQAAAQPIEKSPLQMDQEGHNHQLQEPASERGPRRAISA